MTGFRQRRLQLTLLLMLAAGGLTLSGCDALSWIPGLGPKADPHAQQQTAAQDEEDTGEEGEEEALSPEEKALAALPPAMRDLPYEDVQIVTSDQVILTGRLYDPTQQADDGKEEEEDAAAADEEDAEGAPEAAGPKYPLVVLLPGLNHTRLSWGDLPADLVKSGYAVLALDLRGHGDSSRTKAGRRFSWRFFQPEHWARMPGDVETVLRFFRKSGDYPQVDAQNVALVGEKLGANVAMMAHPEKHGVKTMVLLSPGRNYKGLDPSQAALEYPGAVLVMAGGADEYSFQSAQVLYRLYGGPKRMDLYQDTPSHRIGSGSEMLLNDSEARQKVLDWLKKSLPTQAPAPQP